MSDNSQKIAELRRQADELEAADRAFREQLPEHQLAIALHDMLCRHNHTDGCSWFYENTWDGGEHGRYLGKARRAQIFCNNHNIPVGQAIDFVKMINSYS